MATMQITNIPVQIYWRALDLYGEPREEKIGGCFRSLLSAQGRKDIKTDFPGIEPFAQATAEYMSLSGPFAEDGGEFAGVNGYNVSSEG